MLVCVSLYEFWYPRSPTGMEGRNSFLHITDPRLRPQKSHLKITSSNSEYNAPQLQKRDWPECTGTGETHWQWTASRTSDQENKEKPMMTRTKPRQICVQNQTQTVPVGSSRNQVYSAIADQQWHLGFSHVTFTTSHSIWQYMFTITHNN